MEDIQPATDAFQGTRKENAVKCVNIAVAAFFAVSIVIAAYKLIRGETVPVSGDAPNTGHGNAMILVQCVLGLAAMWLPKGIKRLLRFDVPVSMRILFSVFLFCAIYLGGVFDFYSVVPHWDDFLHSMSSFLTACVGFSLLVSLAERSRGAVKLPPAYCAVFAFLLSLGFGAVWELYEFSFDGLLGLNMQKTILGNGEMLAGHAAVVDTMKDVFVDCIGGLSASLLCYFFAKHKTMRMFDHSTVASRCNSQEGMMP